MKTKRFFAWALSAAMLGSSYVTTRVMADDTNLIKNGNCETLQSFGGASGWWGHPAWIGQSPSQNGQSQQFPDGYGVNRISGGHSGSAYSASWWGAGMGLYTTVNVEKNTTYELSFWYKSNTGNNQNVKLSVVDAVKLIDYTITDENKRTAETTTLVKTRNYTAKSEWAQIVADFNSGDCDVIAIKLPNVDGIAESVLFDDFSVIKKENLIRNPGFEEGMHDGDCVYGWFGHLGWIGDSGWSEKGLGVPCVVGGHSGNYSASWDSWGVKNVITTVAVNKNTDYELKFWYKSNVSGSQPRVELSAVDAAYLIDTSLGESDRLKASTELMKGEILNAPAEWTEVTRTISTGNSENIAIKLMNVDNGSKTVLFDDFSLVEKGATPPKIGVIVNSDFSSGLTSWNIVNQSTTVESVSVENGAARIEIKDTDESGNEYEAAANYAGINQRVPVAANTDYTVTYRYKNDIAGHRFSVYNASFDGTDDAGQRISTSLLNNNADSDNWKTATYNFNSGDNEYVTIEIETNTKQKALFFADDFKMISGDLITSNWTLAGGWNYSGGALSFKNGYQYTSAYQNITVEPNTTYRISYEYTANGFLVSKIDGSDWINIGNETNGSGTKTKSVTTEPEQTTLKLEFMSASKNGEGEFTVNNISVLKVCEELTARAATADISDNQADVSFALSNSKAPVRADVYVALYGENDKLLGICGETDVAISGSYVMNKTITLPSNAEVVSGKAFIWSAEYDENMKPLMDTYPVAISK